MCKSLVTLQYERINQTDRVWHDAGFGANRNGSFWAHKSNHDGFYFSGVPVSEGHCSCNELMRVKDVS